MNCEDLQTSVQETSNVETQKSSKFGGLVILNQINQATFPVFLASSASSEQNFALKLFPYKNGKMSPFFVNEAQFAGLSHQNVISTVHFESEKVIPCRNKSTRVSYTVMELAPFGDFFEILMTKRIQFDEKLARTYFRQLIQGIEYLHSYGVAHLDLKPENILLGENFQLKIADFDHASLNGKCRVPSLGTANFRAPEMLNAQIEDHAAADVYSAGIMLFLFKTSGCLPYLEQSQYQDIDLFESLQERNSEFWDLHCEIQGKSQSFFDEDFCALFNAMTKGDPQERVTISQIVASEWYNGPIYSEEELIEVMREKLSL